jgi:excisionase family DNA binding protein
VTGRLLTAREVADIIGMNPETILRWTRRGEFEGVVVRLPGGAIRFREEQFDAWLTKRAAPTRSLPTTTPSAALIGTVQSLTPTTTEGEEL